MKTLIIPFALLSSALSATSSIQLYAEYHLGEAGSIGEENCPLDSSGNGRNFNHRSGDGYSTVVTKPNAADQSGFFPPNSTACLDTSEPSDCGWWADGLSSSLPKDNFAFGIYAKVTSVTEQVNGDIFTLGGGEGAYKLSLEGGNWRASSDGKSYIGDNVAATPNTWVHLAIVRINGESSFYLNGEKVGDSFSGENSVPTLGDWHLSINPGASAFFDGKMDEARVITFSSDESVANILSCLKKGKAEEKKDAKLDEKDNKKRETKLRHPFLLLDEPTNHLGMETIEAGLRAYDGVLLVASHDEAFLKAIGIQLEFNSQTKRRFLFAHMKIFFRIYFSITPKIYTYPRRILAGEVSTWEALKGRFIPAWGVSPRISVGQSTFRFFSHICREPVHRFSQTLSRCTVAKCSFGKMRDGWFFESRERHFVFMHLNFVALYRCV